MRRRRDGNPVQAREAAERDAKMVKKATAILAALLLMLAAIAPASAYEKWGAAEAPAEESEALYGMWEDSGGKMLGFFRGRFVWRDDARCIYRNGRYTITGGALRIDMEGWPYAPEWDIEQGEGWMRLTSPEGDRISLHRKNWLR